MPRSGSGRKRARAQLDLPSNLKASSSSVYQRGTGSNSRHSLVRQTNPRNDFERDFQASETTAEDQGDPAPGQTTIEQMLGLFAGQFRVDLREALTPLPLDTAGKGATQIADAAMAFENPQETPSGLIRTFSGTSSDATGPSNAPTQSHEDVHQETQPEPKKKRGRPKKRTEEESDIEIILLVGSRSDGTRDYRAIEDAPAELQSFILESFKAAYCDTRGHKNSYMNIVAMENRDESAASPRCINMRMNARQRKLDPTLTHACPYCNSTGRLCARVLHDGHSLKLCTFPIVNPGEATWKDPGFWLEDAEAYSLEPEPSKIAGMEFAKGQPDTALEGFGLQPAGTPTGQKAHEALKQSNEDNRTLRDALVEVVDNSKAKNAIQEAEIRRLQEALNASNSRLQALRNALNALNEQYST
ncbi:hypothetical protein HBI27_084140 [Parastagonospora nodorum]|nr:hypothetical protein HBI27_084140 [Parastagonospora nodorum]